MISALFSSAMARDCRLCGAPYLGGRVCSRVGCGRNGARQRDLWATWQEQGDVEQPPPGRQSRPREPEEEIPPAGHSPPLHLPSFEQEMKELRGLLHELLEISVRIWQRFGLRSLHSEFETLLRVVRVWGGHNIRWSHKVRDLR